GGERLDLDARMAFAQPADQILVVGESEPWMQAADDVELADGRVAGERGLVERLLERHRVRAVLAWRACERAERAGRAQDAHVGRVEVLVRADEDAVAIDAAIDEIGERADPEEVVRSEERERVGGRETSAGQDAV